MATYAQINPYGFIETPYRKVVHALEADNPELIGRTVLRDVTNDKGAVIAAQARRWTTICPRSWRSR